MSDEINDISKDIEQLKNLAEQGNAFAQFNLGLAYEKGQGVKQDYKQAIEWYTKSAEQGNAFAQFNLGTLYYFGQGVKQDFNKAIEWYTKSAEQGNADAQNNLGAIYAKGEEGVEQDYKQAVYWYTKSAEQGNAFAQFNLGTLYYFGQGVEQDYNTAIKWYTKSADQGNAIAQFALGNAYEQGQGVEKDFNKAIEWYTKSAEQGNAIAQFALGNAYEQGGGVEKDIDIDKAVIWYRRSLNGGFEKYGKSLINHNQPLAKIVFEIHSVLEELKIKDSEIDKISLTHFTSFDVFKKVIQKDGVKTLRLQDIDGCNDPMEGRTLFECLEHDDFKNYDVKDSYPLILSFCDGTPENLPMWNTYADNATGVGLKINKKSIQDLAYSEIQYTNLNNSPQATFPTLYQVMYLPRNKKIKEITQENLKIKKQFEALKALQKAITQIDSIMNDNDKEQFKEQLPKLLAELAHIVKYDDYAYENEIRLVRFAFKADIDNESLECCPDLHRVYINAPQVEFESIITAPKVEDKEYLYARYLGDSNNIEVKKSEIKFR